MEKKIYFTTFATNFKTVTLVGNEDGLLHLELEHHDGKRIFEIDCNWLRNDEFFTPVVIQLKEYFSGKRKIFDNIQLNIQGTKFQELVWKQLMEIPYGECWTYKDVACAIGRPTASRAVGMANSKNKIPIIIPCHRVISTSRKLTGFAHGLSLKKKLLELEDIKNIS